jgi:predicted GNAT family acetyltransferase
MNVEHDEAHHRFVVRLGAHDAVLVYAQRANRVLDLLHTYVPPEMHGQGVADALARAAMQYARDHDMRVIPTCPFVRSWLGRHPEDADLVLDQTDTSPAG